MRGEDYKRDLLADLRNNPDYAARYLSAARRDSREAFLVALRDIAEAQQGVAKVAHAANVNRESLYRALSEQGNPRLSTLDAVLDALQISVVFVSTSYTRKPAESPNKVKVAAFAKSYIEMSNVTTTRGTFAHDLSLDLDEAGKSAKITYVDAYRLTGTKQNKHAAGALLVANQAGVASGGAYGD
jgi:probable addiction module antidote protein